MATIINNPNSDGEGTGGSMGMVFGIVIAIAIIVLFVVYGLPALRNSNTQRSGTQVNVPESVDVNLNDNTGSGK